MADKYGVEVVPTLLFFENGAISKRLEGVIRRASLVGWLSGREILVAQEGRLAVYDTDGRKKKETAIRVRSGADAFLR